MTGTRHHEAIQHAADILRERGPAGLTSVAVGERMGITQAAVYRHVDSIDELTRLASAVVVADLNAMFRGILLSRNRDWTAIDDLDVLSRELVERMIVEHRSFAMVDRWRFERDALGVGIRSVIDEGRDVIEVVLEQRWRREFGGARPLDAPCRAAQRAHAQALYDDGHAIARIARDPDRAIDIDHLAAALRCRILAGWVSYVIDLNERIGLPFPAIDLDTGMVLP